MSDGNIIIAVMDTTDTVDVLRGFQVHKSILAKQSSVFADLFTLPQGPGAEEYEGVPIVRLTDSYRDVRSLLCLFYDPVYVATQINTWHHH